MAWIKFVIALVACSALFAQDPRQVIVIAGRAPLLEVIDPVSLGNGLASISIFRREASDSTASRLVRTAPKSILTARFHRIHGFVATCTRWTLPP